jgi:hypothetical protein
VKIKYQDIQKKNNQKLQQKNVKNLKLILKKQFFQILKIMPKMNVKIKFSRKKLQN